jgi:hypothetical protein
MPDHPQDLSNLSGHLRRDHVAKRYHKREMAASHERLRNLGPDCVVRLSVPQAAKRQLVGNEIKAAFIFTGTYFVNVHRNEPRGLAGATGFE